MICKSVKTETISIYLAGDYKDAVRACRDYTSRNPLCVTVTPSTYVYTGGVEEGVCIGLVNYPRFPSEGNKLTLKAQDLAKFLMIALYQQSVMVVTPSQTYWYSCRPEDQLSRK